MKKTIMLLLAWLAGSLLLQAQSFTHPFEILVKAGATDASFELGGEQTITINWGDGTQETIEVNSTLTQAIEHTYSTPLEKNTLITFESKGIERFKNRYNESGSIIGVGNVDAPDLISFYYMSYKGGTLAQSTNGVVDLSKCPKLKYISLKDAPGIQLGNHPQLKHIQIESSKADASSFATLANKALDLSRYSDMEYVWVTNQKQVKELNLTGLTNLNFFRWQNGGLQNGIGLREITKNNPGLKRLNISGHQLPLSNLPAKSPTFSYDEFDIQYNPEGYIIPDENIVGGRVSLSLMATEYDFEGTEFHPEIVWKEVGSNESISKDYYTEEKGVFKFNESLFTRGESLTIEAFFTPSFFSLEELMGSASLPLKTNAITLNKSDIQKENVNIVLKTELPIGSQIALNLGESNNVVLTGVKEEYQQGDYEEGRYLYTLTSQSISISGDISELDCNGQQLTAAHLKDLPNLYYVELHSNKLAQFTASNCPAIEELYLSNNQLEMLDVSNMEELSTLDCSTNALTSLIFSGCESLSSLWCHRNRLSAIDLSGSPLLGEVMAFSNRLSALDLSHNEKLKTLNVADNQIQQLSFTANPLLRMVVCHTNRIKGEAMTVLMQSLPMREEESKGKITIFDSKANTEENLCLQKDVAIANSKHWICYDFMGSTSDTQEYEGEIDTAIGKVEAYNNNTKIYPNPATDFVYIQTVEAVEWSLYSYTGELLLKGKGRQVDLRSLPNGHYILVLTQSTQNEVALLIKQ